MTDKKKGVTAPSDVTVQGTQVSPKDTISPSDPTVAGTHVKHVREVGPSDPTIEATRIAPKRIAHPSDKIEDATRIAPKKVAAAAHHPHRELAETRFNTEINSNQASAPDTSPIASPKNLGRGDIVRNRFVLQDELGRGGMGVVFSALDKIKQEANDQSPYVALKLITENYKKYPQAFITLQREAKKTQTLAHPNIVTVYDFDRDGDMFYITMEQLQGHPLDKVLKGKTDIHLSYTDKISIIQKISEGLAYAHSKGIVHSDLKPANIFYCNDGNVKRLDFGIARAAKEGQYKDNYDVGELGGMTVSYASPEMMRFEEPDTSDDIYSLGIIACEILGEEGMLAHPYGRTNALEAIELKLHPKIPKLKNPFIKNVIKQALRFEREKRVSNALKFYKRFNAAVTAPIRILVLSIMFVTALGLNLAYVETVDIDPVRLGELPMEQQIEFNEQIEEGQTALKYRDLQAAVIHINNAYKILPTDKKVVSAIKDVKTMLNNTLESAQSAVDRQLIEKQMETIKSYPAFAENK